MNEESQLNPTPEGRDPTNGRFKKGFVQNPKGASRSPYIALRREAQRVISEFATKDKILDAMSALYTRGIAGDFRSLGLFLQYAAGISKPIDPREVEPQLEGVDLSNIEGSLVAISEGLAAGTLTVDQAKAMTNVLGTLHQIRDNSNLSDKLDVLKELIEERKRGLS